MTKKNLLLIIRETFQGQKMQLGKRNPPLHEGGCQAVLYKGFVFVVLRQSPDLEWKVLKEHPPPFAPNFLSDMKNAFCNRISGVAQSGAEVCGDKLAGL